MAAIPSMVVALVVFGSFFVLGRIVKGVVARLTETRLQAHRNAGVAVGRLAQGVVLFVGLLVALSVALPSFRPGDVVQVLGISSVAIGFAFPDILQNFLAGILLLVTQPFRIGDQIVAGTHEGTVEDIQTRATFTAFEHRRLEYDIGIGYGDDVELARRIILNTVRSTAGVLAEPPPDVLLIDLAASSINLRVRWWIAPPRRADALDGRDRVLTGVKQQLTAHGIDLPFPPHQALLHDQTEEADGDRTRQREGWPAGGAEAAASGKVASGGARNTGTDTRELDGQ